MPPMSCKQSFLPCEILHLRDLASTCSSASSARSEDDGHQIIICHKDRTSFYKATRKAKRTAQRIWSACSVNNGDSTISDTCDGYLVGKKQVDSQDDANTAISKRLSTEFGSCSDVTASRPDVSVRKFSSPDDSDKKDSTKFFVIFFDLDAISPANTHNTSTQKVQFELMKKDLPMFGKNCVVHIKSETIYRVVTSFGSAASSSMAELDRYFLSKQNEIEEQIERATNDNRGKVDGDVIRRLRGKGAANCPLTIYPARYIKLSCYSVSAGGSRDQLETVEICRFHNYDAERGCLRSKKAQQNLEVKGCDLDHEHCHRCGGKHRAFECPNTNEQDDVFLSSCVFRKEAEDGRIVVEPYNGNDAILSPTLAKASMPALLVLAGRLRGRTLATCEILPLRCPADNKQQWKALPNLHEHRGSHAACSPIGSGLAFVMGGGTADGNSDAVEILNFGKQSDNEDGCNGDWQWHMMAGKLSSPRHAFGAVTCVTTNGSSDQPGMRSATLFAVGGWQYGSLSCERVERLTFEYPNNKNSPDHCLDKKWLHDEARWELCAPLLLPRRLHSVAASIDGKSIFVFGGYVDERRTTSSIEKYDIEKNEWSSSGELPYGQHNCPLVQAVAYKGGFLVFPFSTLTSEQVIEEETPLVLQYTPGADTSFLQIDLPNNDTKQLRLPIPDWHSFAATSSEALNKLFLLGGTIRGKWTNRGYELNLDTMEWKELPPMTFARRRLATVVLE